MKKYLILILGLLSLTACPQASQFMTPGAFDADKTGSGGAKSKDGTSDETAVDRVVSTDPSSNPDVPPPPPGSTPPPADAPRGRIEIPPPVGGEAAPGSGSDQQYAMMGDRHVFGNTIPIDPKNDYEGVLTGPPRPRLRYGRDFSSIVPRDASVPGSGAPYPLEKGNVFNIKLFFETPVVKSQDQYGNNTYGWAPKPDGPQVRLRFHPAGEVWQGSYVDTKVSLSPGGENVVFSNLPLGPGIISFWYFEHLEPSPLPDWMQGLFPDTYRKSTGFNEGSLVPFADQATAESWYTEGFGLLGSLVVSEYVDPGLMIQIPPPVAPEGSNQRILQSEP